MFKQLIYLTIAALHIAGYAQFTFPGCEDLKASDFSVDELFRKSIDEDPNAGVDASLQEPVQFELVSVIEGDSLVRTDVYFVERLGAVKYYNGATRTISEIGNIDVHGIDDYGLMGIAAHPDFANNRSLYLWYAPRTNDQGVAYGGNDWKRMILGRFTVLSNNQLDMNSEKRLIEMSGNRLDRWHAGGPMTFDTQGNLWITVGNNSSDHDPSGFSHLSRSDSATSDEWGASNTANMRGSILRIRPDSSEKGYSIPDSNFGEYWAEQFEQNGNTDLAAEYRDSSLVLPEIYSKGHRSNFSVSVHPNKPWVVWGEVNFESSRDEFNLAKHPVFAGYPYFHGNQERTAGHQQVFGSLQDPNAPRNTSPLSNGVEQLPPAVPGVINGLANTAITGPVYVYDSTLASAVKLPPHLDEHWFGIDFTRNRMWAFTLNEEGEVTNTKQLSGTGNVFSDLLLQAPLQAKIGADGSFYLLNYSGYYSTFNPGLWRVSYRGDCLPYREPTAVDYKYKSASASVKYSGTRISIQRSGGHLVRVYGIGGGLLKEFSNPGPREYELSQLTPKGSGLFLVKIVVDGKVFSRKFSAVAY